jgi:hypothetical protein
MTSTVEPEGNMSLPNDAAVSCPLYNGGKLSNDMRVFLSSRRVAFVDTEKKTSLKAVLAAFDPYD